MRRKPSIAVPGSCDQRQLSLLSEENEISRSHSDEHEKSSGTLRHAVSYKTTHVSGVFIASIIKATSLFLSCVSFCNQLPLGALSLG
jgi:hypothetical protein